MARDEKSDGEPIGIKPAPGARRKPPDAKRVAERVARLAVVPPVERKGLVGEREVVTPLNPGFFQLEHMRNAGLAKKRAAVRKKVRGT